MNDSYRAALLLAGLMLASSIAGWRLVQLETVRGHQRAPQTAQRGPEVTVVQPAPAENRTQPHEPPATDRVAELIDAAGRGNIGSVLALIGKGVNINSAGRDGLTPLLAAIRQGNGTPDVIEKLLRAGADASARDSAGRDALGVAVEKDDVDAIQALLKHSRRLAGEASSAMCDAAAQNHVEALQALIDSHVDVDRADKDGRTALSTAIKQGQPDTVRFLLAHNADPNRKNSDGETALMQSVERGGRDLLQAVLEKAPDVNERNAKGETALMQAVRAQKTDLVSVLTEAGADVNIPDLQSRTPLMAAASAGRAELMQLLLDKGAAVDARDSHDETARSLAHKSGSREAEDLLTKPVAPDGG